MVIQSAVEDAMIEDGLCAFAITDLISARAAFWDAALIARDQKSSGQARRHNIQVLIVLSYRCDIVGEQARAVLRWIYPVQPRAEPAA